MMCRFCDEGRPDLAQHGFPKPLLPDYVIREAVDWWAAKIEENPRSRPLRERLNDFAGDLLTQVQRRLDDKGAPASASGRVDAEGGK